MSNEGGPGVGKGGPGLGKGKVGLRHRKKKTVTDAIKGVTKPAIRRLARRGGIKRINGNFYEEVRQSIQQFLEVILKDVLIHTEHSRRSTVTAADVVNALKRRGQTLYGFGELSNFQRVTPTEQNYNEHRSNPALYKIDYFPHIKNKVMPKKK